MRRAKLGVALAAALAGLATALAPASVFAQEVRLEPPERAPTNSRQLRVLVTGFGPFGGITFNPSWEAAKRLDGMELRGARVTARQLPVVWDEAAVKLAAIVRETRPDIVVCFGVASGERGMRLETTARNENRGFGDNEGIRLSGEDVEGAPATYPSGLPLQLITAALGDADIPVRDSDDAGGYLCNQTFYRVSLLADLGDAGPSPVAKNPSRTYQRRRDEAARDPRELLPPELRPRHVGFVHVPDVDDDGDWGLPLDDIERAMRVIVGTTVDEVHRTEMPPPAPIDVADPAAPADDHHETDRPLRVLITGFGEFGGVTFNPSWEAAKRLDGLTLPSGASVMARELPVVWDEAAAQLAEHVDAFHPDVVICFGVAEGEEGFRLERIAKNENRGSADNEGIRLRGADIPGAPESYPSGLPLEKITADLEAADLPTRFSDDAGGYLCNQTFFRISHLAATGDPGPVVAVEPQRTHRRRRAEAAEAVRAALPPEARPSVVGFVHVPGVREDDERWGRGLPMDEIARGVRVIVEGVIADTERARDEVVESASTVGGSADDVSDGAEGDVSTDAPPAVDVDAVDRGLDLTRIADGFADVLAGLGRREDR